MTQPTADAMRSCAETRRWRFRAPGLILLACTIALALPVHASSYGYPYQDPYFATLTIAILNADGRTPGLHREVVHVPVLPGRNKLPGVEGRGELSVALYRQERPSPLLFILAGIGSNPYFGLSTYLAEWFHHAGYHVVLLPSPMSWNFALAASRSGAPGYTPEDALDLYLAMQQTLAAIEARYSLKPTEVQFLGLSLGALEGAYLSIIDSAEGKIGIARYLLVNPPVDLSHALNELDEWTSLGKSGDFERMALRARAIVEDASADRRYDPRAFANLEKEFAGFTREEIQFLIAEFARGPLAELVCVTQAIHDQKVLRTPKEQMRECLREAKAWTFTDYGRRIGVPLWRLQEREPSADVDDFSARASLTPILDQLARNPRVHIAHNADDILVERSSIDRLKTVMGDRMTVYSLGGHLGNIWYPTNKQDLLQWLGATPVRLEAVRQE